MEDLVNQFMDVTGVDRERAEFYLASSASQLEVALATFYEYGEAGPTGQEEESAIEQIPIEENSQSQPETTPDVLITKESSSSSTSSSSSVAAAAAAAGVVKMETTKSKPKNKTKSNSRITTFSSLQNRDSSSDDEGQQAFYAGGSEHSGQQVLGPSKKNKNDIVNDMFKKCQEQSVAATERSSSSSSSHSHHHHHGSQRPSTFSGTGYKLGQTTEDTEVILGASATGGGGSGEASSNTGLIVLKLWRDGFTVNDREIRSYTDPENHEFLAAIKRGEIPMEIRQEVQGAELRLDMEDHRHEEYVPPKPKVMAFAGKGHKLGSPSPATIGMTVPSNPADQAANETLARSQLNLSSDNPTTTIQIRLADGQNIREQFNLTHTIGDIRRFIITMRPQYANLDFNLLTSYPTKELTEDSQTIQDAALQNSAIMQRLK